MTNTLKKETMEQVQAIKKKKKKLQNYIVDNAAYFDYTNAKLHEVSYQYSEILEKYGVEDDNYTLWNIFCCDEWDMFEEYLKENDCEITHLGRTSSFCIHLERCNLFNFTDNLYQIDLQEVADIVTDRVIGYSHYTELFDGILTDNSLTDYLDDYLDDDYTEIESDINTLHEWLVIDKDMQTLIDNLEKVIECRKYLDGFKEYQIENFEEFLKCNLD